MWTKNWIEIFSIEDIHAAHRFLKICSTFLVMREIQIKTTMRCPLISGRCIFLVIIQKITSIDKYVEKLKLLFIVGEKIKLCSHYGKQYGVSSKNQSYQVNQQY